MAGALRQGTGEADGTCGLARVWSPSRQWQGGSQGWPWCHGRSDLLKTLSSLEEGLWQWPQVSVLLRVELMAGLACCLSCWCPGAGGELGPTGSAHAERSR